MPEPVEGYAVNALDTGIDARSMGEPTAYVFAVRAERDPQVLLRILGLFVQRSIVPARLWCEAFDGALSMEIEAEIDAHLVDRLAEKLRSIVLVNRVDVRLRAAARGTDDSRENSTLAGRTDG